VAIARPYLEHPTTSQTLWYAVRARPVLLVVVADPDARQKQLLGGEDPQSWKGQGPERAAALSLWTYSAVWLWYVVCHGAQAPWQPRPSHTTKRTPSFADALAALRRTLWARRIFDGSDLRPQLTKVTDALIDALAEAA
jgi:hypothetical protein